MRRLVALGMLAVVLAAVVVVVVVRRGGPSDVAAGTPEKDGASAAYLRAGDGAPVLSVRAVSDPVVGPSAPSQQACAALIERMATAAGGRPIALLSARVPDEQLADLLLNEEAARTELLQTCAAGGAVDALLDEVRTLDAQVDARLREMGIQP